MKEKINDGGYSKKIFQQYLSNRRQPAFWKSETNKNQVKKGLKLKKFFEIPSRGKAISTAVQKLNSGDVLIVAGKGHENFQEYKKKFFFSDKIEIIKAIKKKNNDLSNSIKTNIINEVLGHNIINKKKNLRSASINSKKIKKNSIFFGIKGKKFDGNKFAIEAIKNGAALAVSNQKLKIKNNIYKKPLRLFNMLIQLLENQQISTQ